LSIVVPTFTFLKSFIFLFFFLISYMLF